MERYLITQIYEKKDFQMEGKSVFKGVEERRNTGNHFLEIVKGKGKRKS